MALPWKPYVVRKGDHLQRLALQFGTDADALWSHPKNRDLAASRPNRDTLCAGDVLFVPSGPGPALKLSAHSDNHFAANAPVAHVELHIEARNRPIAGKAFAVVGDFGGPAVEGVVSGEGVVVFDVPMLAEHLELRIPDVDVVIPLHLGDLDPIEEMSGVVQRLQNLGYVPRTLDVHPDRIASGLAAFQEFTGIPVSGRLDDATAKALERAHRR